jgi:DNA-directed RNA polymerase subunit RPC12/RpoP
MNKFDFLENNSETYSHTEHCSNCGRPNILAIPKGRSIESHLRTVSCTNCGVALRKHPAAPRDDVWMLNK